MPDLDSAPPPSRSDRCAPGYLRLAISNAIVGLYRQHYGKGPTRSKTYIVDDIVLCVLQGGIVPVERTLVEAGRDDLVQAMRRSFQEAKRRDFVAAVEQLTGRRVVAFLSQFSPESDVSIEFFTLERLVGDPMQTPTRRNTG